MSVRFIDFEVHSYLKNKRNLKQFVSSKVENAALSVGDIAYIFCSDEYLSELNQKFLSHDTLTDIITFDLSPSSSVLSAEIYISRDRVKDNAKTYEVSYADELHRVIFNGMLHLLGYKDKTKKEKSEMRVAENEWLKEYNIDAK